MAKVIPGDQIFQDFTYSQRPVDISPQDIDDIVSKKVVQDFLDELQVVRAYRGRSEENGKENFGFDKSMLAVINAPRDEQIRDLVKKLGKDLEAAIGGPVKYVVHCGIGGSELAATMGATSCGTGDVKYFPITSLNNDSITRIRNEIDPEFTIVIKSTRSNTTMETLVAFGSFVDYLKDALPGKDKDGKDRYLGHCVAVVDKNLEKSIRDEGYHFLPIEGNMSGRFSGLHAANLLTMYLNRVDIDALHEGARHMLDRCTSGRTVEDNPSLEVAVYTYLMNRVKGKAVLNAGILSPDMTKYGDWLGQLVEESLNHRADIGIATKTSEISNKLHSYFQGWLQGMNNTYHQFVVPLSIASEDIKTNVKEVKGRTLSQIEFAEFLGSSEALANAGRPSYTTYMKEVNANALGQMMMRDMIATMFLGELLGLRKEYENGKLKEPGYLHQPGVEAYKVLTRGQLANPDKLDGRMDYLKGLFK